MTLRTCVLLLVFLAILPDYFAWDFKIGYLDRSILTTSPNTWTALEKNAAGITMAIEKLREDGYLDNITFSIFWEDTEAIPKISAGKCVSLRNEYNVDVYMGPASSKNLVPVAQLTAYWNIPVFSWGATDPQFADKKTYNTLIRMKGTQETLSISLGKMFHYFNWTQTAIIMRDDARCKYMTNAIRKIFRKENLIIADSVIYNKAEVSPMWAENALRRVNQRARVIVVCDFISNILLKAAQLNMDKGEHLFLGIEFEHASVTASPWRTVTGITDVERDLLKYIYKTSVWTITTAAAGKLEAEQRIREMFVEKAIDPPWNLTYVRKYNLTNARDSVMLFNSVYLYGLLVNETIQDGGSPRNGTTMFRRARNRSFTGITGVVYMDDQANLEPSYWAWGYNNPGVESEILLTIPATKNQPVVEMVKPVWLTADGNPILDIPRCGFFNELCPEEVSTTKTALISTLIVIMLIGSVAIAVFLVRKRKLEEELALMLWKVSYEDIKLNRTRRGLGSQVMSYVSVRGSLNNSKCIVNSHSTETGAGVLQPDTQQQFINIGHYKGNVVAIKKINKDAIVLDKAAHMELKTMRDLNHENVNLFVGACVDQPHCCLLYIYCSKGSLEDIIENDDIKLDELFKRSLIQDLTNGLGYIHGSALKAHGKIKSSNCVVSSRWVLKITDYGCNSLMEPRKDEVGDHKFYKGLWWTAPEILRMKYSDSVRTQTGDIYSLGIVLYEIVYRKSPYNTDILSPEDIVNQIRDCHSRDNPFRPNTGGDGKASSDEQIDSRLISLMTQCWYEKPELRPTIGDVKTKQKDINKGKKLNIMDNMLKMMERYANNLEELVEHRTEELVEEKKKTDKLLYRMLPRSIAEKLKTGESICPEVFQSVTIYFSDIIKFTTISAMSNPIEVVDLLNDLYTLFDNTIERYDVYKVETIGDAYMVVSGLPERNGERHAGEIAEMALDLLSSVLSFEVGHMPELQLQVRIGIHTGSCCAGVVGLAMPRYCLFGDTVNTASRMESNGQGLRIHLSQKTCDALTKLQGYWIEERGMIDIKGKGRQKTYWLYGKDGFSKRLPTADDMEPVYNEFGLPLRKKMLDS